jgi:hypothetical protein
VPVASIVRKRGHAVRATAAVGMLVSRWHVRTWTMSGIRVALPWMNLLNLCTSVR